ncbi:MAG: L,D-transpeptidase family protein [Parvularculaceae bacterium]
MSAPSALSAAETTPPGPAAGAETGATWDLRSAQSLLELAKSTQTQGADIDAAVVSTLESAISLHEQAAIDLAASRLFVSLAVMEDRGFLPASARRNWHLEDDAFDAARANAAITDAAATQNVGDILKIFEPPHPQFQSLAHMLSTLPADAEEKRRLLEVNMERWRWMPRNLGETYILVNIPAYEIRIFKKDQQVYRGRVIIGAQKSRTPIFETEATGVVINPSWFVPASIVRESVGALLDNKPKTASRLGFVRSEDGAVRQKPGPDNALGQAKLVMPNDYSVFIHGTNHPELFKRKGRALSHGCIRTENVLDFVQHLLPPVWRQDAATLIAAAGTTVTLDFSEPIPIYLVYFTAYADDAGNVSYYPDIYGLDRDLDQWRSKPERAVDSEARLTPDSNRKSVFCAF